VVPVAAAVGKGDDRQQLGHRSVPLIVLTGFAMVAFAGVLALGAGSPPSISPPNSFSPNGSSSGEVAAQRAYGSLPLSFEPNAGRTDSRIDYLTHTAAGSVSLNPRGATVTLGKASQQETIGLRMLGAKETEAVPRERLPGVVNDLRGNDAGVWRTGIPTFERVRYRDLYPGITLDWYGNQRQLEYDFRITPGGDPAQIAIRVAGADVVRTARNGDLVIETGGEAVRQRAPIAYQPARIGGGQPEPVRVSFAVEHSTVRFKVGAYDQARPLIIDPLILGYSTYLGGLDGDHGQAIAVDGSGAAYITGWTISTDFDTVNPIDSSVANRDAFVSKLTADGSALVYSTYLGGSGAEFGNGIAVDSSRSAYIAGATNSADFTTANSIQGALSGGRDAFITKLSPAGDALVYSTYLGGSYPSPDDGEGATGIAVNSAGAAYVAGVTASTDFPTAGAIEGDSGGEDAFVAKVTPTGALAYSTYLGGDANDSAGDIAVNAQSAAFVTGGTSSSDFNTVNSIEGDSGGRDVFISKLTPSGSDLNFSTYLGGNSDESGTAIALDNVGNAVITGTTSSTDFDTNAPLQGDRGGDDTFISKIGSTGSLGQSTYLGGGGGDYAGGIAAAGSDVYVAGDTRSGDFPSVNAIDSYSGTGDAYVTKIALFGTGLSSFSYSTFLGGSSPDAAADIALDPINGPHVVGRTYSADFETAQPIQGPSEPTCCPTGFPDVFITWLTEDAEGVLARRFQPYLRLDEGERWRPLDVERMLGEGSHYVCERRRCNPLTSFSQLAGYPSSSAYIDIGAAGDPGGVPRYSNPDHYYSPFCPPNGGQVMDCVNGPRSAIYYDTSRVSEGGYRYLQYWTFYRFNDSPVDDLPGIDYLDHEADWEQMALAVPDGTELSTPTFHFANFGQHGNNFSYLRENLTCDAGSSCGLTAKHVHGFVAGGTHATYGEPCTFFCTQSNSEFPETDHGGEILWGNTGDASALRRFPAPYAGQWKQGPHAWVDWPGWWGLDAGLTSDHVKSPANQDFYDFPWLAACVDTGCQPQYSSAAGEQPQPVGVAASDECGQWFGSGIAAVSCDQVVLTRTLKAAELGTRPGQVDLVLVRSRTRRVEAATTRGLAQLAARPLRPGDRLLISGPRNERGTVLVRAQTNRRITIASFGEKQVSGRQRLVVERRGSNAIPMLREAGRPSLAPQSVATRRLRDGTPTS
jgi:hypothetical protein